MEQPKNNPFLNSVSNILGHEWGQLPAQLRAIDEYESYQNGFPQPLYECHLITCCLLLLLCHISVSTISSLITFKTSKCVSCFVNSLAINVLIQDKPSGTWNIPLNIGNKVYEIYMNIINIVNIVTVVHYNQIVYRHIIKIYKLYIMVVSQGCLSGHHLFHSKGQKRKYLQWQKL